MKLFSYLKSLIVNDKSKNVREEMSSIGVKEISNDTPLSKINQHKEITERMLTISQCAKKHSVTRQAIFFAIKMQRLNASNETGTWLVSESDLKDYIENRYSRAKSRKEGDLIFDKSKGFYSISEAAKFLGKNTNHMYYLVRMGHLSAHRQGAAIVIQEDELYKYAEFISKKSVKNGTKI